MAFTIPKRQAPNATSEPTLPTLPAPAPAPAKPTVQPNSQLDGIIATNLATLINKLEAAIPDIRTELITIHKQLAKDPAQVTILSPEECAAIFRGYSKLSGIELVTKAAAKKGPKVSNNSIEMYE